MFCFCDTWATRQLKSCKKFNYLNIKVLACCFAAGATTISKNHVTCASEKTLAWPRLIVYCARNKMADTVEKTATMRCAWSAFFFFLFFLFLGMKSRGSIDPVQRGGPWTWGSDFVLSLSHLIIQCCKDFCSNTGPNLTKNTSVF